MMAALSVAQRQRNARGVPGTGKGKAQSRTPPGRTPNLQPSTFNLQPSTFNPSLSYHRPMFVDRIDRVRRHLRDFVQEYFQVTPDPLVVESPPSVDLGDLAFPLPFELARVLRRPPRQIAQEIAEKVPGLEGVERFEAAGAGYVNAFLDRSAFLQDLDTWLAHPQVAPRPGKVIVEHTNINPNKAAHIGHLRNAALGDSFVRLARSLGHQVEVQNYIDNTGVQVADVVVGFRELRNMGLEEVRQVEEPFDYFCWDLYARTSEWLREDDSRLRHRHVALEAIESGRGEVAELAEHISNRVVGAHLKTMLRLGVQYDVLPRESEILAFKFWDQAFSQLRNSKAIVYREAGIHAGCWVMELPEEDGLPADEKIIVRSNGTVTYVGKDIAYQLWKFGLLGQTFRYKPVLTYENGQQTWVTTSEQTDGGSPDFGSGTSVYNVIDVRQSYLQRVVVLGLRRLGYTSQADRSTHFSYEMVALSPACCEELGIELSREDRDRPYLEVSGRKGLGVKADDLIDKLIEKSRAEVEQRQPRLAMARRERITRQIAIGALRYFLLKYTRNSVIAFDFSEALSFEGETGPYLQYAVVRSNNIFHKLVQREENWNYQEWLERRDLDPEQLRVALEDHRVWQLLLLLGRLEEVIEKSVQALEVSHLAKHAFAVARQFNLFYHSCHILSQERARRDVLLVVSDNARRGLTEALNLLGIEVPERM